MTLRLRVASTVAAAAGLIAVLLAVGALFPAVGHSIGKLNIPKGVAQLLGGADYGTITGWFRSEIASIYGPLVIGALAITGAVGATAGEEEERILGLTLSYPIGRSRLVAAKSVAIAIVVIVIAAATWVGIVSGVALGGGGITIGHMAAFALHLAFFGFALGGLAMALGAGTGRRALSNGVGAAVGIGGWLIYGFAPLVGALGWLKYLSLFYYYAHHDPLTRGVGVVDILVLAAFAVLTTVVAMVAIGRRDLRA
jgi:ABC-2 type transport system permease protein